MCRNRVPRAYQSCNYHQINHLQLVPNLSLGTLALYRHNENLISRYCWTTTRFMVSVFISAVVANSWVNQFFFTSLKTHRAGVTLRRSPLTPPLSPHMR